MSRARFDHPEVLDLGPGDMVRVRTAEEISTTLDERGRLDGMPFMPEMVRHCGRTYPVISRADKTCDSNYRLRRMRNAVHLSQLRCDGSAHDGCQAACLMYWKEAWLERVPAQAQPSAREPGGGDPAFLESTLLPATVRASDDDGTVYMCQATEVTNASAPLPGWRPDQYLRDIRNWGVPKVLRGLLFESFNFVQDITRRLVKHGLMPRRLLFREGRFYPFLVGGRDQSPPAGTPLDLRPGDRVRIKSRAEIVDLIDRTNRNRGLTFDVEMLPYCGQTARVQARVNQLIDEQTGRMIRIKSDCLILENVVCRADFHRFCTKATYPYWREAWLEKIG